MRALLVGAGGMGRTWARNLATRDDLTLAGWVDVRPGVAEKAGNDEKIAFQHYYDDLALGLKESGADFVVDVTPPDVHHEVTLAALAAGLPIIGEKPMANSMAEARAMVRASEQAGKLYMVSQSRRYIAEQLVFKNLVQETIGGAGIANVDFSLGCHFGGFRDEMASVLLLDMAIHTFDQARYVTGKNAVSVYAEEYNPSWSWYAGAAAANALFTMEDDLRFTYRGSWCSEGTMTSWGGDWRVNGPLGSAVWGEGIRPFASIAHGEGFTRPTERIELPVPKIKEGIEGSLDEFLNALTTGKTPMGECHDNIQSLAMVFGAIESARRGERVTIAEMLDEHG